MRLNARRQSPGSSPRAGAHTRCAVKEPPAQGGSPTPRGDPRTPLDPRFSHAADAPPLPTRSTRADDALRRNRARTSPTCRGRARSSGPARGGTVDSQGECVAVVSMRVFSTRERGVFRSARPGISELGRGSPKRQRRAGAGASDAYSSLTWGVERDVGSWMKRARTMRFSGRARLARAAQRLAGHNAAKAATPLQISRETDASAPHFFRRARAAPARAAKTSAPTADRRAPDARRPAHSRRPPPPAGRAPPDTRVDQRSNPTPHARPPARPTSTAAHARDDAPERMAPASAWWASEESAGDPDSSGASTRRPSRGAIREHVSARGLEKSIIHRKAGAAFLRIVALKIAIRFPGRRLSAERLLAHERRGRTMDRRPNQVSVVSLPAQVGFILAAESAIGDRPSPTSTGCVPTRLSKPFESQVGVRRCG